MTPKVLIDVEKRKLEPGPLTEATAHFQGRENFQAPKQKLNIRQAERHNYLLSPPTPRQAGKWLPGSTVCVR